MQQSGRIGYPSQATLIPYLGQLLLDAMTWISITGGVTPSLQIGNISAYGDALVRKKIESRVGDPRQYRDLMAELSIAGWYSLKHDVVVTPYEQGGYPDLRVDQSACPCPLLIECKRLDATTYARVRKVIHKANSQVKLAAGGISAGFDSAVVLDLSHAIGVAYGSSEWKPSTVEAVIGSAQRCLSGEKNRSIRQAYVTWDYHRYAHGGEDRSVIAYQRSAARIFHAGTPRAIDSGVQPFEGYTTAYMLFWRPRKG